MIDIVELSLNAISLLSLIINNCDSQIFQIPASTYFIYRKHISYLCVSGVKFYEIAVSTMGLSIISAESESQPLILGIVTSANDVFWGKAFATVIRTRSQGGTMLLPVSLLMGFHMKLCIAVLLRVLGNKRYR